MCEFCESEDEMYPDLGEGAFMEIDIDATWISADPKHGIRIAQKREVTYLGPEGTEKRQETQCVYIGWNESHDLVMKLIKANMLHNKAIGENDDNSSN